MSFRNLEETVVGICNDTFGTEVTYTPIIGSPETITGVFDNAFVEVQGTSTLKPVLRIRLSDLAVPPAKGDQVTNGASVYKVMSAENDAYGGSLLVLQKV